MQGDSGGEGLHTGAAVEGNGIPRAGPDEERLLRHLAHPPLRRQRHPGDRQLCFPPGMYVYCGLEELRSSKS